MSCVGNIAERGDVDMKRLFVVKQYHHGEVVAAVGYFEKKKDAKGQRDELNKQSGGDHFCVSPGPDHRNYAG